jgi:diketogulonate reductase-like aldo/keto reductase
MPQIGLGTYRITSYKQILNSIKTAFSYGIRLIDTAEIYGNEAEIGKAIKDLNLNRKNLFITTKIWNSQQGYDNTLRSFERSLKNLKTDYIDLYLIHWPVADKFTKTWKALENLYEKGLAKNIGVSNFNIHQLEKLFVKANIVPVVNQIELHPYLQQNKTVEFCKNNDIRIEAWSPIAKGNIISDRTLKKIGDKYGKTAIQIALRWELEKGYITIPKSSNPSHIAELYNIFDFQLEQEDIKKIDHLDKNFRLGPAPDNFNF